MKQLLKNNQALIKNKISLSRNTKKKNYSNLLGFKTLNITPAETHFEEWGQIAKKGILGKSKWHFDEEEIEDSDRELASENKERKYFSEEELDEQWDNKFKLGKNWVGLEEDNSSGQDRFESIFSTTKKFRSTSEAFYAPMITQSLPKLKDRSMYFTIEDVPQNITLEDVNQILGKLNHQGVSIEKFQVKDKYNIFVELESSETKQNFLTTSRLNFGIWINGKRCDVYDSSKRQKSVFLAKIPDDCTEEEIKQFVDKVLEKSEVEVEVAKNLNKSYCFLDFRDHEIASNFIERITSMGDQFASWSRTTNYSHQNTLYSVYNQSLERYKERLVETQNKNKELVAILESLGYNFDEFGNIVAPNKQPSIDIQMAEASNTEASTPVRTVKKSTRTTRKAKNQSDSSEDN